MLKNYWHADLGLILFFMFLTLIKSGFSTTIQDLGRIGFRKFGLPLSGAADRRSFILSNWLVNNDKNASVLECCLKGDTYRFEETAIIGITGADMGAKLNNNICPMNKSIKVNKGDVLELGYAQSGVYTYVAIQGQIKVRTIFNSTSTYALSSLGGFKGRNLQAGDKLEWSLDTLKNPCREVPEYLLHRFNDRQIIRVLKGVEWDSIGEEAVQQFLGLDCTVRTDSNRMGLRLEGEALSLLNKPMMASSAVLPGTVQVLPNGQLIVLMRDGQTTGGYPRIAKVIDADLDRLAQMAFRNKISFRLVDIDDAYDLYLHQDKLLKSVILG